VSLTLPEDGSVFVVFRRPVETQHLVAGPEAGLEILGRTGTGIRTRIWSDDQQVLKTSNEKRLTVKSRGLPEPLAVTGPWTLRFADGWGAPESAVFERLTPWNEHPNEGIKYFSGTATYSKSVSLSHEQVNGLVRLQLGKVGHVAVVRVNGKPLGAVWSAPWSVDLTGVVKVGENRLEIEVVNLWTNRLIGDSRLPEEKRFTKSNVRLFGESDEYRVFQGFSPKDALAPSGLIGPVRLEFGEQRDIALP
jgi:hypothetical protein